MTSQNISAFACLFAVLWVYQVQSQVLGPRRSWNLNTAYKDPYICTYDDLLSLISLSRSLEEKETNPTSTPHTPYPSNFEELIMKLVNALVYTTTQVAQNKCHCSHSNSGATVGSSGGHSNTDGSNIGGQSRPSGSLLDVGLGGSQLLGVGLGGSSIHDRHEDSGINLDVLNTNKKNNVADLNIGHQHVLGVGLGGSSNVHSKNYNRNDNGQGLINLDLLNPNKDDNVLSLGAGGENIVGVGLGN